MNPSATLREDIVDGDRCVRLSNDRLAISINVDHGAHLFELIDRRSGVDLLYQDPAGSRDYEVGGWYELFPNAGVACEFEGRPMTAHGDVQHAAWTGGADPARGADASVTLASESSDLPFSIVKTITLSGESARLRIEETITNRSDRRLPYLWGQHVTFGEAFLNGSVIDLPPGHLRGSVTIGDGEDGPTASAVGGLAAFPISAGRTVDLSRFPTEPLQAMLFSDLLQEPRYTIANEALGVVASVTWDPGAWPYLWFWAHRAPDADGLVACAIEPQACEVPVLSEAVAAGRAPMLEAGESRAAWIEFELH